MTKKLTITVSDEVYEGLRRRVGPRRIGEFIENLARPHVVSDTREPASLEQSYREIAADDEAEREAMEWIEENVDDCLPDEDFSDWPGYPSR